MFDFTKRACYDPVTPTLDDVWSQEDKFACLCSHLCSLVSDECGRQHLHDLHKQDADRCRVNIKPYSDVNIFC